jgi:uncharacterized membrane protein
LKVPRPLLGLAVAVLSAVCLGHAAVEAKPMHDPFPRRLAGVGTEPFWDVGIDRGWFRYSSAGDDKPRAARVTRRETNNALRFAGRLGEWPMRAVIRRSRCSDGMSERIYPYSLTLTLDGRTLEGCAYPASTR